MGERTFNRMPRQFFRRHVPRAEVGAGVVVLAVLAAVVVWVAAQRDAYDPAERDVSDAVLREQSVPDRLYRRPFQPWREPGQGRDAPAAPTLGAFPPNILDGPWQVSTRLQQFEPDTLYEKIDGAAEQFLRFGFKRLDYVALGHTDGPEQIAIELYDQGDFAGGLGIFSVQRDPARAVKREGNLHYYETPVGAVGVMGPWYVRIAGSAETPAVLAKTRQLVATLAALPVQEGARPFGFRVLAEGLGLDLGEVTYQAADVFQFDFARDFWFGRVAAGQPARWFLHRARDGATAAETYERLLAEQRYDYDVVREDEDTAVLRHKYLGTTFLMALDGPVIYGVDNAAGPARAAADTKRLAAALRRFAPARD